MSDSDPRANHALGLRAGDWVEVRSATEILGGLDERGRLEALPFMPEMLQFCGKRFRVFKAAHKTCDTIESWYIPRRMTGAVHLEGLRCDGTAHGGCQAECLIFWKEAWLKPVTGPESKAKPVPPSGEIKPADGRAAELSCDTESLERATHSRTEEGEAERYSCQATELLGATTPFRWWDPRPYIKDLTSRNVRLNVLIRYMTIAAFNAFMRYLWPSQPQAYPYVRGIAGEKTPTEVLNLQPGDLVQVRSKEEIMRTIDSKQKNRGLKFDVELVPFCGKSFRVHSRVEKIINEKTGVMMKMANPCITLEGGVCSGCYSRYRLFCPRSIYSYWREIWLKRIE